MIKQRFPALWLTLFTVLAGDPLRAEQTFDALELRGVVYTNATVLNTNATDVFIKHAGGLTGVKVKDLGVEDLKKLGYVPKEPPKPSPLVTKMEALTEKLRPGATNEAVTNLSSFYEDKLKASGINPAIALAIFLAGALVIHIFYSVCMRKICLKANQDPGGIIWIPILQFIPLHRAAGISPGLVLLYFIPPIGVLVFIYWSVKICRVLRKSAALVIMIFIPILNLFFIPYLGLSGSGDSGGSKRMKF